jgi:hypothetical protein
MKIEYSILSLAIALVYGILVKYFPDFPISPEVLLTFLVYVLLKLGVEVVGAPIRKLFSK